MDFRVGFILFIAAIAVWDFILWKRIPRHSDAFISLFLGSVSLAVYLGSFGYAAMIRGFPAGERHLLSIAGFGMLAALGGLAFGVSGTGRREKGGVSVIALSLLIAIVWFPALTV